MATIQGVYVALFGRPADPTGLAYFNTVTNNGANLSAIGNLSGTAEYQARFAGQNNLQIINSIYQSLFGRDADITGLNFFSNQLASGRQTINTIAINILDGATGSDLTTVNNKIAAANLYTAALDTGPEVVAYSGTAAADAGRTFLQGVTTTVPAQTAVDAAVQQMVVNSSNNPGSTLTLTTNIDNLTGTAGNDTFVGDTATITGADTINGGAGSDTLNIFGAGATPVIPTLNSVENLNFVAPNTGTFTGADVSARTSVETVGLVNTNVASTFTINANQNVAYSGVTGGVNATVVTSATDTAVTVNVAGSTLGAVDVQGAALTTLNVAAGGTAASTLASLASSTGTETTVNLSGNQKITITGALDSSVTTVNASANTAGVNVALGASNTTVTGGAGDDRFNFAGNLNTNDTVVGGSGTDIISVTGADYSTVVANGTLAALNSKVTGFETLEFTGTAATTISGTTFTNNDITKILFNTSGAGVTDTVNAAGSARTYAFGELNAGAATLNGSAGVTAVNVSLEGIAGNGGDVGALTVNFTNNTAAQVGTGTINLASIGVNDAANPNTVASITGQSNAGALTSTNVVITGAHDLTIGTVVAAATAGAGGVNGADFNGLGTASTVNASAFTGKLNIVGSDGQDFITGGTGADTIHATSGGDSYTGGAGADTFVFDVAADARSTQLTTITDFTAGTDKINVADLTQGTGVFAATAVNVSAAPDFQGALNLAAAGDGSANAAVSYFQYQGNTYIVVDNSAGAAFVDGTDGVIKLAGLVNVTATDFAAL